jgi:hypothetical protein
MRRRVLLDEHLGDSVEELFGPRAFVHIAKDVGLESKPDQALIDYAINRKCLIITNDEGLVERYKAHPSRRAKHRGLNFFYGMIYVRADTEFSRKRHIAQALKKIAWDETRRHDDLIILGR